jgi:hypothetical protein
MCEFPAVKHLQTKKKWGTMEIVMAQSIFIPKGTVPKPDVQAVADAVAPSYDYV